MSNLPQFVYLNSDHANFVESKPLDTLTNEAKNALLNAAAARYAHAAAADALEDAADAVVAPQQIGIDYDEHFDARPLLLERAAAERQLSLLSAADLPDEQDVDLWMDHVPVGKPTEGEIAARWLLEFYRLPSWKKFQFEPFVQHLRVTCLYRSRLYYLAGASRLGDVWLSRSRPNSPIGSYMLRVDVRECSTWEVVP